MITRSHTKGDAPSVAVYSDCERYRYTLTREWGAADPGSAGRVLFVMLNPSTATEVQNDPTVERCERRARALGYGGFGSATSLPGATPTRKDARGSGAGGPREDAAILEGADWADRIVCAWGAHGAHLDRGPAVERLLRGTGRALTHLGLTKAGHPKHPLYIGYAVQPVAWR